MFRGVSRAVNVIQRPDRQSSLDACCELLAAGYEPVLHLVARGATPETLQHDLERAREAGIEHVLCILGDTPAGPTMKVRDLVAAAAAALPGATIGATLNQYGPAPERAIANLLGKLDAGATIVETQPVFDVAALAPFVEAVRARCSGVRFIAMVMPIASSDALARMESRLGITVPETYARLVDDGPDAAWRAFQDLLVSLRESPLVDGIALMTPDMDPPLAMVARIESALQAARVGGAAQLE